VSCGNFTVVLFAGRRLTPHDFGLFSLAMLGVLFLSNLHRALLTQPLNVLGAVDSASDLRIRMTVLLRVHFLLVPISIALLLCLSAAFFPQRSLFLGAACYLTAFFLQELLRRYWYTIERLDIALINDIVCYATQIIVILVVGNAISLDGGETLLVMTTAPLLALCLSQRKMDRARNVEPGQVRAVAAQHWHISRWLLLTVFALWGSSQLYPFLIATLGAPAIASFSVSRNLLNAMGVVVQSVMNYLPTRVAVLLEREGKSAFRRHLLRTTLQAAVIGAAFMLFMQALSEPILHVLYGGLYDSTAPLLRILSAGMVFSLLGAVFGAYALAMHDSRSTFLSNLGGTVFTFTGGLWMIHAHGIYGAALAACLSLAATAILQAWFVLLGLKRLVPPQSASSETFEPPCAPLAAVREQTAREPEKIKTFPQVR
jgi:O-antigen/teichoic acid export membrane protein